MPEVWAMHDRTVIMCAGLDASNSARQTELRAEQVKFFQNATRNHTELHNLCESWNFINQIVQVRP